jgi:hypothetical protein
MFESTTDIIPNITLGFKTLIKPLPEVPVGFGDKKLLSVTITKTFVFYLRLVMS